MAGLEPTISESKSGVLPLHYIPPSTCAKRPALPASRFSGVGDGARTHDTRNHNPVLIPTELHPPLLEPCPGTPGGTRTPGLLLRRQLLYPAELLAHTTLATAPRSGFPNAPASLVILPLHADFVKHPSRFLCAYTFALFVRLLLLTYAHNHVKLLFEYGICQK